MNISSLSGISSLQNQQNLQKSSSRLSAAIAALASGDRLSSASSDISSLAIATQLKSAVSGLKQASASLAQVSSLAQVADGGVSQIQDIAERIKILAQQASSPVLNDDNRAALNEEFKQLLEQADNIAQNTSFGGKKLLNGALSGTDSLSLDQILSSDESETGSLEIENLSAENLFGGNLDISNTENATTTLSKLDSILNKIISVRADVGSFLKSVDYAAASIDSAIANQEAARSELQDTDFLEAATNQSQATLQQNMALAIAAQGNRLSPALLKLVG